MLAFRKCSWRTRATFMGLTLAQTLPLAPRPRGRPTASPGPRARWAWGRAQTGELPGGPAPGHDAGAAVRGRRAAPYPACGSHAPGWGRAPGHFILGLGVTCGEGAPSGSLLAWGRGGEAPAASPPGTPGLGILAAVPFTPPPMTWPRDTGSPGPGAPAPAAPADAVRTMRSCGRARGRLGRAGSTLWTLGLALEGKQEPLLPQLERHPRRGFCGRLPPGSRRLLAPGEAAARVWTRGWAAPILTLLGLVDPHPLAWGL